MSITFDHIVLSRGTQLTDEELDQLEEIVKDQRKDRSLISGDLDFDKNISAQYQIVKWDYSSRKNEAFDITFSEVLEILDTGTIAGHVGSNGYKKYYTASDIKCKGKESKQFRFIRMTKKRINKVIYGLDQIKNTSNGSNYIDFPTAREILSQIEKKVGELYKRYEEDAEKLIKRAEKKGIKAI